MPGRTSSVAGDEKALSASPPSGKIPEDNRVRAQSRSTSIRVGTAKLSEKQANERYATIEAHKMSPVAVNNTNSHKSMGGTNSDFNSAGNRIMSRSFSNVS